MMPGIVGAPVARDHEVVGKAVGAYLVEHSSMTEGTELVQGWSNRCGTIDWQ